jgi:anaerobic magnesium-protoporphyrin IX monomethyl ester cyclase
MLEYEVFEMIKVLLINPPLTHFTGSIDFDVHLPIGLMYVAASVRDICHVEIFDCLAFDFQFREADKIVYGAPAQEIRKVIEEKKPDIVGITVHATAQFRNSELVAKIAKEVNPEIVTVFGGPDPSVRFQHILENQFCDYCIVGDGEETFFELITKLTDKSSVNGVKGLAYKKNGVVQYEPRIFSENLDTLPFPAYDLVDMKGYFKNKKFYRIRSKICEKSTTVITSRGCPNRCVFCSVRLHMGQKYRTHSPEYVIKLLRFCKETYGISNFHFEDDNLTLDKQRFERILDLIIEENLQIQWDTPNGVRIDSLNYPILKKAKQSGCIQLAFAIESGNQRVLDNIIHKGLNLEKAIEVIKFCKELKIQANAFYVIGFPGETINDIRDTINFAIKLYETYDISPILMVATPLYGTELYEICLRDKLLKGEPTCEELSVAVQSYGEPMISTVLFSRADVKRMIKEFNRKLRVKYIFNLFKHPRRISAFLHTRI